MSVVFHVVLLDCKCALENNHLLSFNVDLVWFSEFDTSRIGHCFDVNSSLVQFCHSVIRVLFIPLELPLVIDVIIDLDVLGPLDIQGVWGSVIVDFLSMLLVDNCRLEAHGKVTAVLLDA